MSDHLSDEQNAYNAAYIKGRRDMAAEFEAAERALVERLSKLADERHRAQLDAAYRIGYKDRRYERDFDPAAALAALAGDSSHSGTGGEG